MRKLNASAYGLMMIMMISLCVSAQRHDTIWVPVTYYDYWSDRTNPEFEQPHQGGVRTGAVLNRLDSDFKPVAGPNAGSNRSMGIAHWFRDWQTYSGGAYGRNHTSRASNPGLSAHPGVAPGYNPPTQPFQTTFSREWDSPVSFTGNINLSHDTSFKNIVIRDSLPFRLMADGSGRYEYVNDHFFPLRNRGFAENGGDNWVTVEGARNRGRNYAFTMELVYPFIARDVNNMVFNFEGDDDVWVFVDDFLVLDLGGIKSRARGSFRLRDHGISEGGRHTLRVFYAERHSEGSVIQIQTNIVSPPADIKLSTSNVPGNTGAYIDGTIPPPPGQTAWTVEDTVRIWSHIFSESGDLLNVNCDSVTWKVTYANGRDTTFKGCNVMFVPTVAGNMTVNVTYVDPENPNEPVTGQAGASFRALPADSLWVMREGYLKDGIFNNNNEYRVTVQNGAYFAAGESEIMLWIVEVDRHGNFVQLYAADGRPKRNIIPEIADKRVVSVSFVTSNGSQLRLVREFAGEGLETIVTFSGQVYVCEAASCLQDRTAAIETGTVGFPATAIGPNPFIPGRSDLRDLGAAYDFYKAAIDRSNTGGKGVLITADAPAKLKAAPGVRGRAPGFGKVTIYDAVGNVVHVGTLFESGSSARSYAYAWDGKNTRGRTVGPGTYLVVITGVEEKTGTAFNPPRRKIGVKGTGK
ncbi:MAG: fibro-slime domain-containing protein [Chitinispirillia bacterium]|nr:fibro-slime domain-containing protein [Chitinispirillia bacterium]